MSETKIDRDLLVDRKGCVPIHVKIPYHLKKLLDLVIKFGKYQSLSSFCCDAIREGVDREIEKICKMTAVEPGETVEARLKFLAGIDTSKLEIIKAILDAASRSRAPAP
jgi:Arc/MetJ-type ribon-helix-helix transcriptional regulator